MDKISINLLPSSVLVKEKEQSRKSFLLRISVAFLVVIILIAGATLFVRINQKSQLSGANQDLIQAHKKVDSLKSQESTIVYLKQRLDSIATLKNQESKPVQAYNLMNKLTPIGVDVSSFTIDKSNKIIISAESQDNKTLKSFFDNLTDPVKNQGKVTKVRIDDLSQSKEGGFRLDVSISTS
jgi:Tfp pilus assembly protein PilN